MNNHGADRWKIADKIRPPNCPYCGFKEVRLECCHFPRFFYSCEKCEGRIEILYDWRTLRGIREGFTEDGK